MSSFVRDLRTARKMKRAGFQNSLRAILEARRERLPLSYAMAFLDMESERGKNFFGSDGVRNPVKGGIVTRARYLAYKKYRKAGLGMQGVGPMQLTWHVLQDAADALGGCYIPKYNLRIGFRQAAELIRAYGVHAGVARYNGAGPEAETYAHAWAQKQARWHALVS